MDMDNGINWYDKDGKKILAKKAMELSSNFEYKRVAETTLPTGFWISTVWLGLDHSWGSSPPTIFESMVFKRNEGEKEGTLGETVDQDRYSTLDEALKGHAALVKKWSEDNSLKKILKAAKKVLSQL